MACLLPYVFLIGYYLLIRAHDGYKVSERGEEEKHYRHLLLFNIRQSSPSFLSSLSVSLFLFLSFCLLFRVAASCWYVLDFFTHAREDHLTGLKRDYLRLILFHEQTNVQKKIPLGLEL